MHRFMVDTEDQRQGLPAGHAVFCGVCFCPRCGDVVQVEGFIGTVMEAEQYQVHCLDCERLEESDIEALNDYLEIEDV